MKIGYPCINNSIDCTANSTFRLRNYSEGNLKEKIKNNLSCLNKILEYNLKHNLLFFRISSDLIPFASHPICTFNWQNEYKNELKKIGEFIKKNNIRISMHPDQFVLINALNQAIVEKSIKELEYHCNVLDSMGLDSSAKIQIHVGGVYGDKKSAIERFITNYLTLPDMVKKRLTIENDERLYSLKDCLYINSKIGIPIIFDSFHHECFNNGEDIRKAIMLAKNTWKKKDGILMLDYSSQKSNSRIGSHTESINLKLFQKFILDTKGLDFDIMLEIKDKEKSALKAVKVI
jgi:UV DNA damage endonuclease